MSGGNGALTGRFARGMVLNTVACMASGTRRVSRAAGVLVVPGFITGAALGQLYTNTPIVAAVCVTLAGAIMGVAGAWRWVSLLTAMGAAMCAGLGLTGGATGGAESAAWAIVALCSTSALMAGDAWRWRASDAAALGCGMALAARQGAVFTTLAQLLVLAGFASAILWVGRLLGAALGRRADPNNVVFAILLCVGAAQFATGLDGRPRTLIAGVLVALVAAVAGHSSRRGAGVFTGERSRAGALLVSAVLSGAAMLVLTTNRTVETVTQVVNPQGDSPGAQSQGVQEPNQNGTGTAALARCSGPVGALVRCYADELLELNKTQGTAAMVAAAERAAGDGGVFGYVCHAALTQAGWEMIDVKPREMWQQAGSTCGGGLARGLWLRQLSVRDQRIFETGVSSLCNNQRAAIEEIANEDTLAAFQQVCPNAIGTVIGKYSADTPEGNIPVSLASGVRSCLEMQTGKWMLNGATSDCMDGLFLAAFLAADRAGGMDARTLCSTIDLAAKSSCIQQAAAVRAAEGEGDAAGLFGWCEQFAAGDDTSCAKGLGTGFTIRAVFEPQAAESFCAGGGDLREGCLLGVVRVLNAQDAKMLCGGLGESLRGRCEGEAGVRRRDGIAEIYGTST